MRIHRVSASIPYICFYVFAAVTELANLRSVLLAAHFSQAWLVLKLTVSCGRGFVFGWVEVKKTWRDFVRRGMARCYLP